MIVLGLPYMLASLNEEEQQMFLHLYESYKNLMYHIAFDSVKNADQAEEVVAQAFVRIMEHFDEIKESIDSKKTKNWIAIIVRNLAIDEYRRKKRIIPLDEVENVPSIDDQVVVADEYDLKKLIAKLPDRHRDMLYLTYLYKHHYEEIGKELGISAEAARKRIARARKALLDLMKEG